MLLLSKTVKGTYAVANQVEGREGWEGLLRQGAKGERATRNEQLKPVGNRSVDLERAANDDVKGVGVLLNNSLHVAGNDEVLLLDAELLGILKLAR